MKTWGLLFFALETTYIMEPRVYYILRIEEDLKNVWMEEIH